MSGRRWLNTHPRWPLIITESSLHLETLLSRQALTDIRQGKTNCQARKVTNNRPWLLACTSNNLGLCDKRQAESLSFTFSTGRAFPSKAWAWNERFSPAPFLRFFFFFCLHVSGVFVLVYKAYCYLKGIHFIATSFKNCSKIYTKDQKPTGPPGSHLHQPVKVGLSLDETNEDNLTVRQKDGWWPVWVRQVSESQSTSARLRFVLPELPGLC